MLEKRESLVLEAYINKSLLLLYYYPRYYFYIIKKYIDKCIIAIL